MKKRLKRFNFLRRYYETVRMKELLIRALEWWIEQNSHKLNVIVSQDMVGGFIVTGLDLSEEYDKINLEQDN